MTSVILNQNLKVAAVLPTTQKLGSKSPLKIGLSLLLDLFTLFISFLTLFIKTDRRLKVKSMRMGVLYIGKLETDNIKNKFPTE